ncbi:MAG: NAD-dependent epimerase/dehydratase family protein [Bacteroidales bacterium]
MIFVTGGTGFIGAHFLFHLLEEGEEVIALRRPESNLNYVKRVFSWYTDQYDKYADKIKWLEGSIENPYVFAEELKDVDAILHLAAMVSFYPAEKYMMKEINIKGTAGMVNLALEKGIQHFIYMSSVGALDPVRQGEYITEQAFGNNPVRNSVYGESKFKSELEVWRGIEEGLNAVVVNPSIVIGPGMPMEGFGKILDRVKKGLNYYPGGTAGFVDVRDVCGATWELYNKKYFNERYILSEGNYSYKDILSIISNEYGVPQPSKPINRTLSSLAWRIETLRSKLTGIKPLITKEMHLSANNQVYFDNSKIKAALGYQFIPIEKTIRDMVKFNND